MYNLNSFSNLPKMYRYPGKISEKILEIIINNSGIKGELIVQFSDNYKSFGNGLPSARIWFPTLYRLICLLSRADYNIGDFYKKGYWHCNSDELYNALKILSANDKSTFGYIFKLFRRMNFFRDILFYKIFPGQVRSNISFHYDTNPEFMRLILGDDLIYTCAFFDNPDGSLEEAQHRKIDLVGKRLNLQENERVLDLGCGWGATANILSQRYGAFITGISISSGQINYAQQNSVQLTDFICTDYVNFMTNHNFDKVYSIGMLEHVGKYKHANFFSKIKDVLKDDGIALVHSIIRDRPGITNSWIDKEVFPGAYIPSLSEVMASIEKSGLVVIDTFCHQPSNYYNTLQEWHNRFIINRNALKRIMMEDLLEDDAEEAMRVWEFYLCGSRLSFDIDGGICKNIQITLKKR